jgi:hypothetical protein
VNVPFDWAVVAVALYVAAGVVTVVIWWCYAAGGQIRAVRGIAPRRSLSSRSLHAHA